MAIYPYDDNAYIANKETNITILTAELEQLVYKFPYVVEENKAKNNRVLFCLPAYAYFVDSIYPLIYKYLLYGKICIVAISIPEVIEIGYKNIKSTIELVKKIQFYGGHCYNSEYPEVYLREYSICFVCSEYSGWAATRMHKISNYVVALQTTALYTHMYRIQERFSMVFSEKEKEDIDYMVASDYMADWICEHDGSWNTKILRFGYPKLDKLYDILQKEPDIPEDWKGRVEGKTIVLFTANTVEEEWLDFFEKEDGVVMIWRPHPLILQEKEDFYKQISKKYQNVIIDDSLSYYSAFKISHACVSGVISSIMLNYLYTGKPLCFYDVRDKHPVINFRQEAWYKAAYIVDEKDVLEFVKMVRSGASFEKYESERYRRRVVRNFDGRVCDKIYNFFEEKLSRADVRDEENKLCREEQINR